MKWAVWDKAPEHDHKPQTVLAHQTRLADRESVHLQLVHYTADAECRVVDIKVDPLGLVTVEHSTAPAIPDDLSACMVETVARVTINGWEEE